jgi:hypothetical protein
MSYLGKVGLPLSQADIGTTVQGYDADTAKYDDATANFTGTLQNGGSNVVVDTDIGSTVQAYNANLVTYANNGNTAYGWGDHASAGYLTSYSETDPVVGAINGLVKANGAGTISAASAGTDYLAPAAIGTTVQAYDADTAKTDTAQNFTAPQRSADTVDNDGSFDLSAAQNFTCTPTGNFTLTFTNIPDGQSGVILLVNSGGYTVSAAATTKVMGADFLTTVSTAGTYVIGYYSDGTNVRVYNSGAQQ